MSGYSTEEQVVRDSKVEALAQIIETVVRPSNILVVGCGDGSEAAFLAHRFDCDVTGIDIGAEFEFNTTAASKVKLIEMDAMDLQFPDGCFDFVYSFHALEHIRYPNKALDEISRVLKDGGHYLIGTPNKFRLVGYIGSATTLKNKIIWNLYDMKMRLTGNWSNEKGAHAGFTWTELLDLCSESIDGHIESISQKYYSRIYPTKFIRILYSLGIARLVLPCHYVLGSKSVKPGSVQPHKALNHRSPREYAAEMANKGQKFSG